MRYLGAVTSIRGAGKKILVAGLAAAGLLLAGCTDDVNSAINQVDAVGDKASTCSKALGIVDLNPNVDPQQVADNAGRKAEELRRLGEQAANADLQQTLFDMADQYVQLEKQRAEHLQNFTDWLRNSTENLQKLQRACT